MGEEKVEELSAEIGGQKLSLKSVALNTVITILILLGVGYTAFSMNQHQTEAKESSHAFVSAIKEQTSAMKEGTSATREQTCLLKFDQKDRPGNAEFCKQITR